jgi:hypothetical protein
LRSAGFPNAENLRAVEVDRIRVGRLTNHAAQKSGMGRAPRRRCAVACAAERRSLRIHTRLRRLNIRGMSRLIACRVIAGALEVRELRLYFGA